MNSDIKSTDSSRPWPEILQFYQDLVERYSHDMQPMVELVEQLIGSGYCEGIYGLTSVFELQIAQRPPYGAQPYELLRINYNAKAKEFNFSYDRWKKNCPANQGYATLEYFLTVLANWFITTDSTH